MRELTNRISFAGVAMVLVRATVARPADCFTLMDTNPVFAEYLRAGLFEIGDDDTRLAQLTQTVDELAAELKDKPAAIRCYTLAALDASLPLTNPQLLRTHELLKGHWKGLEGKLAQPRATCCAG